MFAVLRVRFNSNPAPGSVWSDQQFASWLDPAIPFSLAHYWRAASRGTADLRYVLFPTVLIDDPRIGLPATATNLEKRLALINGAIAKAHDDAGFDADGFSHVLLWYAQATDLFGGTTVSAPRSDGGQSPVTVAVCDIHSPFDGICHEVGHALGLNHPWSRYGPYASSEYRSPYDIMGLSGTTATFLRPPSPTLPDGVRQAGDGWSFPGSPPQHIVGPLLSGAQLQTFPVFGSGPGIVTVDPSFATASKSVTLHALDTVGRDPWLARIEQGFRTFTVEYRRRAGYDAGVGDPDGPSGAIVVHSHEYGRVYYDGALPVPSDGDLDWYSALGHFVLRLEDVAADQSWVRFRVGGDSFWTQRRVSLEETERTEHALSAGHQAVDVTTPCVAGTYDVERLRTRVRVTLLATSTGYVDPRHAWSVKGQALTEGDEQSVRFDVPVTMTDPVAGSTTSVRTVTLNYSLHGARLTLDSGIRAVGNFHCEVAVSVAEGDPGVLRSVVPMVTDVRHVAFRCVSYRWEDAYEAAWKRCFGTVNDRYSERTAPGIRIDPGDPPPYFIDPVDLLEVMHLEAVTAAMLGERDRLAGEVTDYVVGRYAVPREMFESRVARFTGIAPALEYRGEG